MATRARPKPARRRPAALSRQLRASIRAVQHGAARIGAGDFHHRVELRKGDGLAGLAAEFNRMATRLQESHAKLQQEVDARNRDLTESLEQQTATAEILRV